MPAGAEVTARAFYAGVLSLQEVAKPPELADRGGCWFAAGQIAIHLGVEVEFHAAAKAHPALIVRDMPAVRVSLAAASIVLEDDDSGLDVRRCYVRDPFGNRIELVDANDAGFSIR